jgi:hypothetical protein
MEQKWIDKLKNFEATPPAGLWDRVESALEPEAPAFAQKLKAYEVAPPPGSWDQIESRLEEGSREGQVPVITMRRRRTWVPYLAAASVIGILMVASAILLNRGGLQPGDTLANNNHPARSNTVSSDTQNPVDQGAPDKGKVPASENKTATADVAVAKKPSNPETRPAASATASNHTGGHIAPAATASIAAHHPVDDERYLVRAYNDGSVVRFSKKVSPVVDCAENATGFTQSLCRVSMGAVQDKLAGSVTTDFGSLIERLQDLEKTGR